MIGVDRWQSLQQSKSIKRGYNMLRNKIYAGFLSLLMFGISNAALAEEHIVNAKVTAFDPIAIKIAPGDSVSWKNMSGHNVHFEEGNIPESAESYVSPLGDNVSRTFDEEGVYLYKCDPHFAMGMVGAIIVGEPVNMADVEANAKGMYKRALIKAKKL
ncbi:MAG: plastocyanin/azurin family copper-binding protein [Gammaproteobacteria bacterium]|nr:plastocyanin/azurin family copper-binding protein [Gammaproteobacteria bacterium]